MISLPAPAKLNLYLHVTGKRDDGYHLLDSLVAFAAVHDTISVEPADRLRLTNIGPFADQLNDGPDNLVMQAAMRLQQVTGVTAGARITLIKRLPVASGIGGGSADAAAAIKALARLWDIHPGHHDLSGLALSLGADVPICLFGQAAFMGGIGENLEPLGDLPEAPMVLVNPGVDVSTPAVFKARTGAFSQAARFDETPETVTQMITLLNDGRDNDLMMPALSLEPVIGDVIGALSGSDGCRFARMSGSGATCFGFFADASLAEAAAKKITETNPGWWTVATRLVSDTRTLTAETTV